MTVNGHNIREIGEAARLWALRVSDPAFADWGMFTDWLGANQAHLEAYECALDEEEWATRLFQGSTQAVCAPVFEPAPNSSADASFVPPLPTGRGAGVSRRRWIAQGAMAASVAALALTGAWLNFAPKSEMRYQTAFGEHRTIALPDGSKVSMNGETEVRLPSLDARHVTLVRGEALFEVVHNDKHPFVVDAGETTLVDLGTVFNVVHQEDKLDVAVSEGVVEYRANHEKVRLEAGNALARHGVKSPVQQRSVHPSVVGSWRSGYLQYDAATLLSVADDLARNLGKPVRVTDAVAQKRLSGTIMLDGASEVIVGRAAALAGVGYAQDGKGWVLTLEDGKKR